MSRPVILLSLSMMLSVFGLYAPAARADWQDWWQTPEQRAARALADGDYERLQQQAPDAGWQGLGHYRAGDHEAASAAFAEQLQRERQAGEFDQANRTLYNKALSDVQAGQYQQALEQFDTLLQAEPDHADALHNRAITEQLLRLQQQAASEPSGQGGQSGDDERSDGEGQSDSQQPGESSSASQQNGSESGQNGSASEDRAEDGHAGQSGQAGQQSGEAESAAASGAEGEEASASTDASGAQSEADRQAAAEAARQALAAQAQQADSSELPGDQSAITAGDMFDQPLSESEQAAEQLLRRIPDDPAGLLRRRLLQSHRQDYPEVRDGVQAW